MKKTFLMLFCLIASLGAWADGTELWTSSTISEVTNWSPNGDLSTTLNADGSVSVTVGSQAGWQWGAQVKIQTDLGSKYSDSKQYVFSCKVNTSAAVGGATLKIDDNTGFVYYDQKLNFAAGDNTITTDATTGKAGNGLIIFDFGYAAAGTTITLSDFSMVESEISNEMPDLSGKDAGSYASSGTASLGNDGNSGTRWESAQNDNQWWAVNYGEQHSFNTIKFIWEGAYAKSFEIYGSNDGKTWGDPIKTVTDQSLSGFPYTQIIDLGTTYSYQYILFKGVARGTGYGYSFWEFEAYVPAVSVLTTFTATPASAICKVGESDAITIKSLDQYGAAMDVDVAYTVSPADAGAVAEGKYTPAKAGNATITATSGELTSSFTVFAYAGENVALNKTVTAAGYNDAARLVDGNDATEWQGDPSNGTSELNVTTSFVVDLGAEYNLELTTIHFEGACSDAYTLETSADNEAWSTSHTFAGTLGINNHTDYLYGDDLANNTNVRYIRFTSTKNSTQWGMKIFEFQVFGTETPVSNVDVTVDSNVGYSTMYYDTELTTTDDVNIYTGAVSGNKLVLTKLDSKTIPANTAVLIDKSASFTATSKGATFSGTNDLRGVNVDTATTTLGSILVLGYVNNTPGFYTYTGETLGAHKAYLEKSGAAKLSIVFDDETTTGIEQIENGELKVENSAIYNTVGQRVNANHKGIVIVNGKKFVNK